jgi:predicted metal-binding transcription factor (methanogenesis marker protein 9)
MSTFCFTQTNLLTIVNATDSFAGRRTSAFESYVIKTHICVPYPSRTSLIARLNLAKRNLTPFKMQLQYNMYVLSKTLADSLANKLLSNSKKILSKKYARVILQTNFRKFLKFLIYVFRYSTILCIC